MMPENRSDDRDAIRERAARVKVLIYWMVAFFALLPFVLAWAFGAFGF